MAKKNYVNNRDFYDSIVRHREALKRHEEEKRNTPPPPIPDYVGSCFMEIATRLARRSNFSGYSFKDEFIADAIENCVIGYWTFDPARSTNPFAFFTQTAWYAFLRRIEKEKKQSYIKHMSLVNMSMEMSAAGGHEVITIDDEKAASYVAKFEKKKTETKKKPKGLEKFTKNDA